jgi:dTDP-4-dehydrorhamnose reductase
VTSERYLDENLRDHPPETHGGNERERYADRAAVRARLEGIAGPETLLRETCARYGSPVAVTEAHLGCTRDEQLRWLGEVWNAAQTVRREGHDVRAVTAWSLLGAFDWNSLLTHADNSYEPGVFDLRGGAPRPTALAHMLPSLARNGSFQHPIMQTPGWWRRAIRLARPLRDRGEHEVNLETVCPPEDLMRPEVPTSAAPHGASRRQPLLIIGGAGRLGTAFARAAELRGLAYRSLTRAELDAADADAVAAAVKAMSPWAVINCAGFSSVDAAEREERACVRANVYAAESVALACAAMSIPHVTFSSDHVFDGSKGAPYVESDACNALNVYGASKVMADQKVLATGGKALIIRPGKLLAPADENDFLLAPLRRLAGGERVRVAHDLRFSVTFLPDLVNAALDLLIDGETGLWHLPNPGVLTPQDLVVAAADMLQLDADLIKGVPLWSLRPAALRARFRGLESERAPLLPPLTDALQRYCADAPRLADKIEAAVAAR